MKRLLNYILAYLSVFGLVNEARAQNIKLNFANRDLSADGLTWTFDLEAKGDQESGYQGNAGKWQALNIRLNLNLPQGVTILGGTGIPDPAFTIGSAPVNIVAPGEAMQGQSELTLTLTRTAQQELSTSAFTKLASFTISFSGPLSPGGIVSPRITNDITGSSWTNLSVNGATPPRRQISMDATFPLEMGALPVKLVRFSAARENQTVFLTWATSEEINADHFDIQRSENGKKWSTFQTVNAKGDSKTTVHYETTDFNPRKGQNLYRLHMIDKDGTSTYSSIKSIDIDTDDISFFPNPVSDLLTIEADDLSQIKEVRLLNMQGIQVKTQQLPKSHKMDVRDIPAGNYILQIKKMDVFETNHQIVIVR